ncbi:HAD family hydrolase [Kiloniella antarctica]|uniref:HAD family hydrolase n=1 Tax=Kiloniella antarctica TaxID=1550907 RepID=A0ABW5BJW3_9PROT
MPFLPNQLQAVVFDMDGVLIDSEILYLKAAKAAAHELGFIFSDDLHQSIVGSPQEICDKKIHEAMGPEFPFADYNRLYSQIVTAEFHRDIPIKPGVRELLSLLRTLEIPIAVATSTDRGAANDHLSRAELAPYFRAIITRDDVSRGKPHPEPYLLAANTLGVDAKYCLALEDSHNGVRSAHGAGMQTIMVPDMLPATKEISDLCIAVMNDLHRVREIFEARGKSD